MNRDIFIKNLTGDRIEMSPKGRCANELSVEEFEKGYEKFFEMIFEVADTDVSSITGYGEFDEDNKAPFATFEEFVRETFNEDQEFYMSAMDGGFSFEQIPISEEDLLLRIDQMEYALLYSRRFRMCDKDKNNTQLFSLMLPMRVYEDKMGNWKRG